MVAEDNVVGVLDVVDESNLTQLGDGHGGTVRDGDDRNASGSGVVDGVAEDGAGNGPSVSDNNDHLSSRTGGTVMIADSLVDTSHDVAIATRGAGAVRLRATEVVHSVFDVALHVTILHSEQSAGATGLVLDNTNVDRV